MRILKGLTRKLLEPIPGGLPIAREIRHRLAALNPANSFQVVRLHGEALDHARLEAMRLDPDHHDVIDDLIAFSGLSKTQIAERLLRKPRFHFKSEFAWQGPQDFSELAWFYRTSSGYLFANAAHPYWRLLDLLAPGPGRVLDYGAGAGSNVLGLLARGFRVDYLEIGLIQEAFIRFRIQRRGLKNATCIAPYAEGVFDPIRCVSDRYRAIVLQDVLEHVPNYHVLLGHLIDQLPPGGLIFENSPFEVTAEEIEIHLRASMPLERAMRGMERVQEHVWRKPLIV